MPMSIKKTTNFISKQIMQDEFLLSSKRLINKLDQIKTAITENGVSLQKDSYHLLTRLLTPEQRYDKLLFSHIFKTIYQAEKLSASAGFVSLISSIKFIEEFLKSELSSVNSTELINLYEENSKNLLDEIQSKSKRISMDKLSKIISTITDKGPLHASIMEAIELAGMEGNIHVENSQQACYGVELRHGYAFRVSPYNFFLSSLGSWESYNAKFLCIDGIIEKVSELDKIFMKSSETKIPLVLIAQGYSEEVIATIKTNNDRGVFNILPIRIEQHLENLNVLNDIAVVTGGDIVSTLKGDMLIYVDYEAIPIVEHLKCTDCELFVNNAKTRKGVAGQIKNLLDKRSNQIGVGSQDLILLIDKRISNLISHSVVIRLPNIGLAQQETVKTKIDISLRMAKTLLAYGYHDKISLLKFLYTIQTKNKIEEIILNTLKEVVNRWDRQEIPALSLYTGNLLAGKTILSLMSSSGIILCS